MASDIQNFLKEQFCSYEDHFIAMGESYHGFSKAYQAYTSAVILLESSFFFPANSYLTPEISQNSSSAKSAPGFAPESLLSEALSSQDSDKCGQILKDLEEQYFRNTQVLPDQTKDLYYKPFSFSGKCPQTAKAALTFLKFRKHDVSYGKLFYLSGAS